MRRSAERSLPPAYDYSKLEFLSGVTNRRMSDPGIFLNLKGGRLSFLSSSGLRRLGRVFVHHL